MGLGGFNHRAPILWMCCLASKKNISSSHFGVTLPENCNQAVGGRGKFSRTIPTSPPCDWLQRLAYDAFVATLS